MLIKKFSYNDLFFIPILILASCGGDTPADDAPNEDASSYTVSMNCSSATDCQSEAAHQKPAWVVWGIGQTCEDLDPQTLDAVYFGSDLANCNGAGCEAGPISNWMNSDGQSETISEGTYALVTYFDTDEDDRPSVGEAFSCNDVYWSNEGESSLTVQDYEDY